MQTPTWALGGCRALDQGAVAVDPGPAAAAISRNPPISAIAAEVHAAFKRVADLAFVTANLILVTSDDSQFCVHSQKLLVRVGVETRILNVDSAGAAAIGIALAFPPLLTDGPRVVASGRFSAKRLEKGLVL